MQMYKTIQFISTLISRQPRTSCKNCTRAAQNILNDKFYGNVDGRK